MKTLTKLLTILALCLAVQALAGDIGIPHEKHPMEQLVVGGQPTLENLDAASKAGITTVVNLRREGEFDDFDEQAEVEERGMRYIHIPLKNIESITAEDARTLHEAIASSNGPVLLHCTIGWRASGLIAIEQYLFNDASKKEAVMIAEAAHMDHSTGDVKDWISENGR